MAVTHVIPRVGEPFRSFSVHLDKKQKPSPKACFFNVQMQTTSCIMDSLSPQSIYAMYMSSIHSYALGNNWERVTHTYLSTTHTYECKRRVIPHHIMAYEKDRMEKGKLCKQSLNSLSLMGIQYQPFMYPISTFPIEEHFLLSLMLVTSLSFELNNKQFTFHRLKFFNLLFY